MLWLHNKNKKVKWFHNFVINILSIICVDYNELTLVFWVIASGIFDLMKLCWELNWISAFLSNSPLFLFPNYSIWLPEQHVVTFWLGVLDCVIRSWNYFQIWFPCSLSIRFCNKNGRMLCLASAPFCYTGCDSSISITDSLIFIAY